MITAEGLPTENATILLDHDGDEVWLVTCGWCGATLDGNSERALDLHLGWHRGNAVRVGY